MKLFGRTPGYYIFWVGFVYFVSLIVNMFWHYIDDFFIIEIIYVVILSLPLWIKPIARYFNMRTFWNI